MDLVAHSPDDLLVLLRTRQWLERAVIGLTLCPFAKSVHVRAQVRYSVSHAETYAALRDDLRRELLALSEADPDAIDTTLLVAPRMLSEFLDYNEFLKLADAELEKLRLDGVLQIASFHPDYCFADLAQDDVANCSNRSPYPILHLLREASVTRAVRAFPEAAQIFEKNVATLRALGQAGFERVLLDEPASSGLDAGSAHDAGAVAAGLIRPAG